MNKYCYLILLLSGAIGLAQNQSKDTVQVLDEVNLIEAFIAKKALGITESTQIDLAALQPLGPIDFAAGLNQISGLYVLSGALNTNRITLRGVGARTPFGTDKLRLYFNGIPVTNGTGVSTIEAYDFENMGRVEVIKGPKGSGFGANLGGAISLNTTAPQLGKSLLQNKLTLGSYGLVKDNLSFKHAEQKFNINLHYNHLETEGYRQNNSFKRDGLLLNTSFKIAEAGKINLLLNQINYRAAIPSSLNETDFKEDPTRAAANWLAAQGFEDNAYTLIGLAYSQKLNPAIRTTNSVFYTYLDHYEARPFNIIDEFTHGFGLRSLTEGRLFKGNFTIGAELYRDEYHWQTFANDFRNNNGNGSLQGNQLSNNKEFRSQLSFFGMFNYPITPRLKGQVGLNLNRTTFDFRDRFNSDANNTDAQRSFDPIVLPNLGLRYLLKNGRIFANASRGFSNPGLEETLTPDGVINPDLAQEKGWSYELGSSLFFWQEKLQLAVGLYQMDIKDLLVSERLTEDLFIGRNAGKTRHQGAELDLSYQTQLTTAWRIFPKLSYTYNHHTFVDFVDNDNNFSGNKIAGVPQHRLVTSLNIAHHKGFSFYLNHRYVGKIPLTDNNTLYSDAFTVCHAKAVYDTAISQRIQLGLQLGLNNIFNTNYAQSVLINARGFGGNLPRYFYPANGRNYYSSIKLSYLF